MDFASFVSSPMITLPLALVYLGWAYANTTAWTGRHVSRNGDVERRMFRKKPIMTGNELEFFGRLQRALKNSELVVVPQVSMGAIMDVVLNEGHPHYWYYRKRFSQKICDYIVCKKKGMEIVTVVELDDRTHDKAKDAQRDAMLGSAGLKVVRWESRQKPSEKQIRETLLAAA